MATTYPDKIMTFNEWCTYIREELLKTTKKNLENIKKKNYEK